METVRTTAPVLVGVDGSSESHQALAWAMEFAATRKLSLVLLTAYRDQGSDDQRYEPGVVASLQARTAALTGIFDRLTSSGIEYEHIVADVSIASLIRQHAAGASMVVLGSRPRNRWHQRLRPSLARRLNGRIACPVLSIPAGTPLPSLPIDTGQVIHGNQTASNTHAAHHEAADLAMA